MLRRNPVRTTGKDSATKRCTGTPSVDDHTWSVWIIDRQNSSLVEYNLQVLHSREQCIAVTDVDSMDIDRPPHLIQIVFEPA